jgi:hypothetical protein
MTYVTDLELRELNWLSEQSDPKWGGHLDRGEPLETIVPSILRQARADRGIHRASRGARLSRNSESARAARQTNSRLSFIFCHAPVTPKETQMTRAMALKAAARNKARKALQQGKGPVLEIYRNTSINDPDNGYTPTAGDNLGTIVFSSRSNPVLYEDLVTSPSRP